MRFTDTQEFLCGTWAFGDPYVELRPATGIVWRAALNQEAGFICQERA